MATEVHLADEAATIEAAIGRLEQHRNGVSHAARGNAGSQDGHALGKKAADLTVAIRSLEEGLLRLKDIAGLVHRLGRLASPAVHGSFEVLVSADLGAGGLTPREALSVHPEQPITQLINAALILLFEGNAPGGVWGLWRQGHLVRELTVHDARIQAGDQLGLRREHAS